ncbi:unnamed protein product [Rotaria sp. Silwood1]|nr:unnamed protein product [Rotaria sp. Silwood1]
MIPDDIDGDHSKEYSVVATKRHKPCLIFRGYRYVQDKIQNRTIYWRCEDRTHCNGRAHQLVGNGSLPILTIKHNHQPIVDDTIINESMTVDGQRRQKRRQNLKTSYYQQNEGDDLLLSSTSSTMTSPIKIENHQNRQQHLQQQQHGAMVKNLHLSEVITTAAATNTHHYNGIGLHRHNIVDPIEMTKLLSNITTTTTTPSNPTTKTIPTSSNMDYSSRLNHFSWEEIEGRYLPVIFRNENDCLQRYTSKMYVENTLFQSESWQRYAILARSLPPLISFPYTENELKLFRLIVEWHLASFHFKTILPSDCLIRFEDLLDFYGALRKLRDSVTTAAAVTTTTFNRPLPPPPPPAPVPMAPPKPRVLPSSSSSASSSSNSLAQSFELPTMTGNSSIKQSHTHHRHSSSTKIYPPTVHHSHSSHYLLQQNADLLASFSNPSSQTFNFNTVTPKSNVPLLQSTSNQWNENLSKTNDKIHPPLPVPRPPIPMNNTPRQEPIIRDKQLLSQKLPHQSIDNHNLSRETKESGWVQINNVFVPYIVKLKLRESELDDEEKKFLNNNNNNNNDDDYYVDYRHLDRCIELLNDLKRGTISMTLLPSSNTESQQQQQQTASIKSQLAGIYFLSKYIRIVLRQQEQEEIMIKNLKNLREGELTKKSVEFEQIQNLLITTKDAHIDDMFDLYVQIVLKQGQVEVQSQPADLPPDQYRNTDVELINRHEVEDLNKSIIESANLKIRQMEKTKGVVNELQSMKWEKEKLTYEITDLKQRAQDITFLKVTRNVQEYLACSNDTAFESQKQRELQMLEATIEKMKQRFDDQKSIKGDEIRKLQYDNLSIANVTLAVDEALQNANVNLYERKNIIDQRIVEQSKADQQDRIHQVVRRRRLVDLAKAQAQEVAYLRAEVERLRMKTFPALVQIEH